MYNLPEITESAQRLDRLVRKERDAQVQRRLHMLLLLKTGKAKSRSAAARRLGVHHNTIASWLNLYEEGGIGKLRQIKVRRSKSPDRSPDSSRFLRGQCSG